MHGATLDKKIVLNLKFFKNGKIIILILIVDKWISREETFILNRREKGKEAKLFTTHC